MSFRVLFLALALVGCGDSDSGDDDDDKPIRDGGGGSATGTGDDGGGDEGSGDEGGEGGGEEGGGTGDETFKPEGGTWTYTGGDVISDPCDAKGFAEDGGGSAGDGTFSLTNTSATSFTMKAEDGAPFKCTLTDMDYVCEQLKSSEPVDDYDVMLHSTLDHQGSFSSETAHLAHFNLVIDCQGGDCELAEWYYDLDFPCTVIFTASAEFTAG